MGPILWQVLLHLDPPGLVLRPGPRPEPDQHWLEHQFHFQLGRTEPGPVFKFGIGTHFILF
jgi:hypothetical protein